VLRVESLGSGRNVKKYVPEAKEISGGGLLIYDYKDDETKLPETTQTIDTSVQEIDVTGKVSDKFASALTIPLGKGVQVITGTGETTTEKAPIFKPFITSGTLTPDRINVLNYSRYQPKEKEWEWGDPSPYQKHGYDPQDLDFNVEIRKIGGKGGSIELTETSITNIKEGLPTVTQNIEYIKSQIDEMEKASPDAKFKINGQQYYRDRAVEYYKNRLGEQTKIQSDYQTALPKLESSLVELRNTKTSLEDYQQKGYTLDVKNGKYEIGLPSAVTVHEEVYGGKIGYKEPSLVSKVGSIFPPIALAESTKMLLAGQEAHGIKMATASLIASPFGLQTLWDVGASAITGDWSIAERRAEETAKTSLDLSFKLKKEGLKGFTGKVLTEGALVEGVYLPIASMGVGKAFQVVGKGAGALGTWVSGGQKTGLLGFSGKVISKAPTLYFGATVPLLVGADIGYTEAMGRDAGVTGLGISKAGKYVTSFAFFGAGAKYGSKINLGLTKSVKIGIGKIKAGAGNIKSSFKTKVTTGLEKTAYKIETRFNLPESNIYQKGIKTYGKLKGMTYKQKVITDPRGKVYVERVGKDGLTFEKTTTGKNYKVIERGYSYKLKEDLLVKGVQKPEVIRTSWKGRWGTKYEHVGYGEGKDVLLKKGAEVTRSFGSIEVQVKKGLTKRTVFTKFNKLSLGGDVKELKIETDFGKVSISSSEMLKIKHFIGNITTSGGVRTSKGWTAIKDIGYGKAQFKFEPTRISKPVIYKVQEYTGKLTKAPEIVYGKKSYTPLKTGTLKLKALRYRYLTVSGKYAETGEIIVKGEKGGGIGDKGFSAGDLKYRLKSIISPVQPPSLKIDYKPLSTKQTPIVNLYGGKTKTVVKTKVEEAPVQFTTTGSAGKTVTLQKLESLGSSIVEPYKVTRQQKATKKDRVYDTLLKLDIKPVLETVEKELPLLMPISELQSGTISKQRQEDYLVQMPYQKQSQRQEQKHKTATKLSYATKQSYKTIFDTGLVTSPNVIDYDPNLPVPLLLGGETKPIKKKVKRGRPRKKLYRLSKKKIALKSILADPFSVQSSQIKYGKATIPKVTKKIWKEFEKTGKVRTVEQRQEDKKPKSEKIDFNYSTSKKSGGDKITLDLNIIKKKKKKKPKKGGNK